MISAFTSSGFHRAVGAAVEVVGFGLGVVGGFVGFAVATGAGAAAGVGAGAAVLVGAFAVVVGAGFDFDLAVVTGVAAFGAAVCLIGDGVGRAGVGDWPFDPFDPTSPANDACPLLAAASGTVGGRVPGARSIKSAGAGVAASADAESPLRPSAGAPPDVRLRRSAGTAPPGSASAVTTCR